MRKLFQYFLIVCGILLSVFSFSETAKACSCYLPETVNKEFAKTPNVAILKLQSIKQYDGEAAKNFLSVERVFKGELKVGEVIYFKYESFCSWSFSEDEIGTEFLFYLGERPVEGKNWEDPKCSRSGRIKSKTNDISYLENEEKLRGKTRLSGKLDKRIETIGELQIASYIPLPNRKIRITGNSKNIKLTTDENGFYEIYDLPVGKYRITPEKLEGFVFSSDKFNYTDIEIKAKNHTEEDFNYEIDNEISGKIIDRNGKPLKEICVNLIFQKNGKILYPQESCNDDEGKFEINAIPPGTYKIVINKGDVPFSLKTPNPLFDTFYYPNALTEEEATEINVEANYFLRNLKFVPPKMLETVILTGKLLYSDGKPAAYETIQFLTEKEISESSDKIVISDFEVRTDANGNFSIDVLKGKPGILSGIFYSVLGNPKNCLEIEELLKRSGDKVQVLETNRFEIAGTENINGIELKFPFPECKEAK